MFRDSRRNSSYGAWCWIAVTGAIGFLGVVLAIQFGAFPRSGPPNQLAKELIRLTPENCDETIHQLKVSGPGSDEVIKALVYCAHTTRFPEVRWVAILQLEQADLPDAELSAIFKSFLNEVDVHTQFEIVYAILKRSPHDEEAANTIRNLFRNGTMESRVGVCRSTKFVPGEVRKNVMLPLLRIAIADENADVRAAAVKGISSLDLNKDEAMTFIIQALQDKEPAVRIEAATACYSLPVSSRPVPYLVEMIRTGTQLEKAGDEEVRIWAHEEKSSAAEALGRIGAPATSAIPDLATMVLSSDAEGKTALDALKDICEASPLAAGELLQGLKSDTESRRIVAIAYVIAMGRDSSVPLSEVKKLHADPNDKVRELARFASRHAENTEP